jgi:hypothetical protein
LEFRQLLLIEMSPTDHQRGFRNWRAQHGGWRLVATLAIAETTPYGVLTYAFGEFLLPMEQELDWSRTALTGAYATATVVSGVAAIPVGRWLDRHGATKTIGVRPAWQLLEQVRRLALAEPRWASGPIAAPAQSRLPRLVGAGVADAAGIQGGMR